MMSGFDVKKIINCKNFILPIVFVCMFVFMGGFLFFTFFINTAYASSVLITEIMYNLEGSDADREWIEVCNFSNSEVNLGNWRFYEDETDHYIRPVVEGGETCLPSGSCAVIADKPEKFKKDHSDFSGLLLDSSFSLRNDGEVLALKNTDLNKVCEIEYSSDMGETGEGGSLQLLDGKWTAISPPSPGEQNNAQASQNREESVTDPDADVDANEGAGENDGEQTSTPDTNEPPEPTKRMFDEVFDKQHQIYAHIKEKQKAVAGAASFFEAEGLGFKKEPLKDARYIWNFGDGTTKEGKKVRYHYEYPGEYLVYLTVASGKYTASDRMTLKVIPADVEISKVGEDYIELSNNSSYNLNLSFWHLRATHEHFTLPENTILLSGGKVRFSSSVTGLETHNQKKIKLLYPNAEVATVYSPQDDSENETGVEKKSEKQKKKQPVSGGAPEKKEEHNTKKYSERAEQKQKTNSPDSSQNTKTRQNKPSDAEALKTGMSASVASSASVVSTEANNKELKWILALFGIMAAGSVSGVSFQRRIKQKNKKTPEDLEENEENEENIDIKILE